MNAPTSTLAERLVLARARTDLGQEAVARAVGMTQPSYSALETGKSRTTVKIGSLSHLFGVDAYWLETGDGDMRLRTADEAGEYHASADLPRTATERLLLHEFRRLDKARQQALLILIADTRPRE